MSEPRRFQQSDPRESLQALVERGEGNSADAIMLRVLWLRQEHPEAAIVTKILHFENERIVMHAAISLKEGAAGSGIAAASIEEGDDFSHIVERTETAAISRALDTLGYVLRGAVADRPGPTAPSKPAPDVSHEEQVAPQSVAPEPVRQPPAPPTQDSPPTRMDEPASPALNTLRRANRPVEQRPASGEDDAHLEEYSWNAFWKKARALGLTPDKVTETLGQPASQMSPKEAVDALVAAGAWPQPDGE